MAENNNTHIYIYNSDDEGRAGSPPAPPPQKKETSMFELTTLPKGILVGLLVGLVLYLFRMLLFIVVTERLERKKIRDTKKA